MSKNLIELNVDYNNLTRTDTNKILLTDTRSNIKYTINFSDEWAGKGKVVIFTNSDGYIVSQIYSTNNFVPISMLDETIFTMSVYSLGEERITTNPITIEFKKSGYSNTVNSGLIQFNQEHDLPYLYKAEYNSLDYDYALDYFEQSDIPVPSGACSAVYDKGIMGRNLDWYYSEMVDCIIKTPNTIGVAGAMTEFTREFVESGEYNELYRILPFYLQDGVNSNRLCCATLVTPNIVSQSIPAVDVKESVNSIMLVRYILDKFTRLEDAVNYLNDYVEIVFHPLLCGIGYNQHWILSQGTHCVILEVNDKGELRSIDYTGKKCSVTNFHLDNVIPNEDHTVYTPSTQTSTEDAVKTNNILPYGSGLERFNLIQKTDTTTQDKIKKLMKELRYSKIYDKNTAWYTDFVSPDDGLTCNTRKEIYENVVERYSRMYPVRSRQEGKVGFGFWNTNHSSVYDTDNKKLIICSQEEYVIDESKWYEYTL